MRHIINLYLIFTSMVSFGQNDSIGVYIPKDDGSPFNWQTKHMWVGIKNSIAAKDFGDLIKVWTDNGKVDTGDYYYSHYCIIPARPGKVTITAKKTYWTGKEWDTTITKNTFTAIVPPDIKIQIVKDNLIKDTTIEFRLVYSKTNTPVSKRYVVGRIYQPLVYNSQDSLLGEIPLCFGTTIGKWNLSEFLYDHIIESGYKMRVALLIRDMQTDLLIPTNELTYIFK